MSLPPAQSMPRPRQKSGLAVASLTLGIAGIILFVIGPILGVAAVICGHKARGEIRRSEGRLEGMRLAAWGLATGYLATVLIFIGLFTAIFLAPQVMAHQRVAQQRHCQENLQLLQGYKEEWALQFNRPPTAIPRESEIFGPGKYLDVKPTCPSHGTYFLNPVRDSPYCTVHGTIRW